MKIIGIDSSGLVASVAIWEDGNILALYSTNFKKTHSETLLPMLEELRNRLDLDLSTVDAISIASGPGSYTGLRIGSATAKGLGLVMEIPIVEVPTLEGLAMNLWGTDAYVCPMMDARRSQVYSGVYEFVQEAHDMRLVSVKAQEALPVSELLAEINRLGKKVIFLGDGVPVYQEIIEREMQVPFAYAPAHQNRQSAASVAALGAIYFAEGKVVSAAEHAPEYLRKSQAENEGPKAFEI